MDNKPTLAPDPTKDWPALLVLAVAIFGPPSVAVLKFTQAVTHNPWLTALLIVAYEILVVLVSIVSGVWQLLRESWVKRLASAIDTTAKNIFSHYYRYYRQYFFFEHRDLDLKGLGTQGQYTLHIQDIFVELCVDSKPAHQASSNPLHNSEELLVQSQSIWEYLAAKTLQDQHLVILGAPGSGKTTLLKHLGLSLLHYGDNYQQRYIPSKLPLLLFLRDHAIAIRDTPNYSLPDAVRVQVSKWKRDVPPRWVEHRLIHGHCLVLLDGLDEVADASQRQQVAKWVESQMIAYGKNRFVLTSRPFGYRSNPINGVALLEVQPFTFEKIIQFVNSWYMTNEIKSAVQDDPGVRMKAEEGAQDLIHRLRANPALSVLAVNPLLLTMIATIHRYRGALPGARIELYKDICEVFLGKRQQAHGIDQDLRADQRQIVLQALAYEMMIRGQEEIMAASAKQVILPILQQVSTTLTPKAFLQSIEQIGGILLEREQGIYAFAHLTFQEYLAAVHIRENSLEQLLTIWVNDSWWHETIRLYCAQADASAIIAACLGEGIPSVAALVLALECLGEKRTIQPSVEQKLNQAIDLDIENAKSEHLHVIGEALLTFRLRQMRSLDERRGVDTSLVTCVEYQLFIDEQQTQGRYMQPDHWKGTSFPRGEGRKAALGVRASDAQAFCAWLTARDGGIWSYRLPHVGELNSGNILDMLQYELGYWTYDDQSHFVWLRKDTEKIEFALSHARKLIRSRDQDRTLDKARDLDFDHALEIACIRVLKIVDTYALDFEHVRTLVRNRIFLPNLDRTFERTLDHDFDYVLGRALDYVLAHAFDHGFDYALDLYFLIFLLVERLNDRLPAYEGILLVREWKKEDGTK